MQIYKISPNEYLFQWSEIIPAFHNTLKDCTTRIFILSNVGVYIAYANAKNNIASSLSGTFIAKLEHEPHYFQVYMKLQNELLLHPL